MVLLGAYVIAASISLGNTCVPKNRELTEKWFSASPDQKNEAVFLYMKDCLTSENLEQVMKKRNSAAHKSGAAKEVKKDEDKNEVKKEVKKEVKIDDEEFENQGFSEWLRSGAGIEYMKVFVVLNTLIVFLTMSWPQIELFIDTVKSFFE